MRWTGKHGVVNIGGYTFGDLQDWELTLTERQADVTALEDFYTHRAGLDRDCKVTVRKFVSNNFAILQGVLAYAYGPFLVQLSFGLGTPIFFEANMFFDNSTFSNPDGATNENVSFVLAEDPTIIPAPNI